MIEGEFNMSTTKKRNIYILESINGIQYLLKRLSNHSEKKDDIIKYILHKAISKIIYENSVTNIEVVNNHNGIINSSKLESIIYKVARILEHDNKINLDNINSYYIDLKLISINNLTIEITPALGD